jgi:hypothetical protein
LDTGRSNKFPERSPPVSQGDEGLGKGKSYRKYFSSYKLLIYQYLFSCIASRSVRISYHVDVDLRRLTPMDRRYVEVVGVRRTGWAALDRDPQEDKVDYVCPHCGAQGQKNARRERALYHFTDGFLQDLQGEVTQCRACNRSLRVVPIVMLHDQDETRRFEAVFSQELSATH